MLHFRPGARMLVLALLFPLLVVIALLPPSWEEANTLTSTGAVTPVEVSVTVTSGLRAVGIAEIANASHDPVQVRIGAPVARDWASVSPASAILRQGAVLDVVFTCDASHLSPGAYQTSFVIKDVTGGSGFGLSQPYLLRCRVG